jgi:hypothetical protein
MLLMIPLASVGYALAREFAERRLAERNIPVEKLEYQPLEYKSRLQQNREHKEGRAARALQRALKKIQKDKEK